MDIFEILALMNKNAVLPVGDCFGDQPLALKKDDAPKPAPPVEQSLYDWLGDNANSLDPAKVQTALNPMLLPGEKIHMAFKSRKDVVAFTSHRYTVTNHQNSGRKIQKKVVRFGDR